MTLQTLRALALGGAAALALAACSRSEPEAESTGEVAAEQPVPPPALSDAPIAQPSAAEPAANTTADVNAAAELPPPPPAEPDEQMLDDASATGMTARTRRSDEDYESAETAANAEEP